MRVAVVGDVLIDIYWYADRVKDNPEAGGGVHRVRSVKIMLGGAGNTAFILKGLGGVEVDLFGAVGGYVGTEKCTAMSLLHGLCLGAGIGNYLSHDVLHHTPVKVRVVSSGGLLGDRIDFEKSDVFHSECEMPKPGYDAYVVQDYGKGTINDEVVREIVRRARGAFVISDPAYGVDPQRYAGSSVVKPNSREVSDWSIQPAEYAWQHQAAVVSTRGCDGMDIFHADGRSDWIPSVPACAASPCGAGDAVAAGITHAVLSGMEILDACRFASALAAMQVETVECRKVPAGVVNQRMSVSAV